MPNCNYVTLINETDCIGDSLYTINDNFNRLNIGLCNIIDQFNSLISPIAPSFANLRLSVWSDTPYFRTNLYGLGTQDAGASFTPDNVPNPTSIYLHPVNGNNVGLYNVNKGIWQVYQIPGSIQFSLNGLAANTNYDIYLGNKAASATTPSSYDPSSGFYLNFVPWNNNNFGNFVPSTRTTLDGSPGGVRVYANDSSQRFIGCLRTVGAGETEMSYGLNFTVGGSSPKMYLWNAYNKVNTTFNIFEGRNDISVTINSAANNGPFQNFGGAGHRVSFICGDAVNTFMKMEYYQSGGWSYLTHVLDKDSSNNVKVLDVHRQGQIVSESQGNVSHTSTFNVQPGCHFIQEMAMSYNNINYMNRTAVGSTDGIAVDRHVYGTIGTLYGI
jgi:hypothetical protein